jgi:hypothetical protein
MKAGRDVICRALDLAAVKAYYAGELGLPIVLDTDSMVGFDTGAVTMYFERGETGSPVFEFFVDDVARAKARLTTAGCEVVKKTRPYHESTCEIPSVWSSTLPNPKQIGALSLVSTPAPACKYSEVAADAPLKPCNPAFRGQTP